MSGYRISITDDELATMKVAFELGLKKMKARGYRVDPEKGMIFYWSEQKNATMFPMQMTPEDAFNFARPWLAQALYSPEPDTDGHCRKGFTAYSCEYSAGFDQYAFFAIKPTWIVYGK